VDVGSTNGNHTIGRAIINGTIHDTNKIDDLSIGRWDGSGAYINFSGIKYGVTAGNHSNMTFHTWGNSVWNTKEVMRLTSRGQLGINTSTPSELLDVNGNMKCSGTLTAGGDLSIGNGLIYLPKPGSSLGTIKLGLGGVSGADDNTNMKIELHGAYNSDGESGNMIIRTYAHLKIYSQYFTVPQMFINGQQGRIGLGTATPDARLHVTAGVSTAFGNEGVSTWLGYIGMMNSSGVGQYYWGNTFGSLCAIFDTNVWCKSNSMASSDIRIKKDIEDINDVSALEKILQFNLKHINILILFLKNLIM